MVFDVEAEWQDVSLLNLMRKEMKQKGLDLKSCQQNVEFDASDIYLGSPWHTWAICVALH